MIQHMIRAFLLVPHFRDYKPQPVSLKNIYKWIIQFDKKDWGIIIDFFSRIIYFSSKKTEKVLIDLNNEIIARLKKDGLSYKKVIYVQIHDPGSSSPVMLNLLRDGARLEGRGCKFVDGKDVRELNKLTDELGEGAIVYIDDFSGTGTQFCESHNFLREFIIGNFAEFFLLPCICEESLEKVNNRGISVMSHMIHTKTERPLHEDSHIFDFESKKRLVELCRKIDKNGGLGYRKLASMVVFYRNAPNTVPVILRGSIGQKPFRGILPRTTDLPKN